MNKGDDVNETMQLLNDHFKRLGANIIRLEIIEEDALVVWVHVTYGNNIKYELPLIKDDMRESLLNHKNNPARNGR